MKAQIHQYSYFNPRSREGSDASFVQAYNINLFISIHAPAKGATQSFFPLKCSFQFQSTPPRRERRFVGTVTNQYTLISIHAPAKGATYWWSGQVVCKPNFNPRPREGSDGYHRGRVQYRTNFNPRPREGSDLWE